MNLTQEIVNIINNNSYQKSVEKLYNEYDLDRYDSRIMHYITELYRWKEEYGLINLNVYEFGIDRIKNLINELAASIEKRRNNIIVSGKNTYEILKQIFGMSLREQKKEALIRQFGMTNEQADYYISKFKNYVEYASYVEYDLEKSSIESEISQLANSIDEKINVSRKIRPIDKSKTSDKIEDKSRQIIREIEKKETKISPEMEKKQYIKNQLKSFFTTVGYNSQVPCLCEAFNMPENVAKLMVDMFKRIGTPPEKPYSNPSSEYEKQQNVRYKSFNDMLERAYSTIEKYANEYNKQISESEGMKL